MSDIFAKNLRKQSSRAKEKLLVSLGKADQTVDADFEEHAANFGRQQKANERLHKELKAYVACAKASALAARGFQEALRETYEPEWPGGGDVRAMSQSLDLVWDDYTDKLQAQVLAPLAAHAQQFTDMRAKIAKRGRKLVDYDGARHSCEAVRGASEPKQQKAQEAMLVARKMYEDLNRELCDELPALYDSRITFYVNSMQAVFNLEQTFHSETAKLSRELCVQMDQLGHALGRLRVARSRTDSLPTALPHPPPPPPALGNRNSVKHPEHPPAQPPPPPKEEAEPVAYPKLGEGKENGDATSHHSHHSAASSNGKEEEAVVAAPRGENPFGSSDSQPGSRRTSEGPVGGVEELVEEEEKEEAKVEEPKEVADEAPKEEKEEKEPTESKGSPTVLYKVRATHRYAAEDNDELSFEAGELIEVLPFDDPEEQDEGWLYGRKESEKAAGVFPANFTKPA